MLVWTDVELDEETHSSLEEIAQAENRSVEELIVEAIGLYMLANQTLERKTESPDL